MKRALRRNRPEEAASLLGDGSDLEAGCPTKEEARLGLSSSRRTSSNSTTNNNNSNRHKKNDDQRDTNHTLVNGCRQWILQSQVGPKARFWWNHAQQLCQELLEVLSFRARLFLVGHGLACTYSLWVLFQYQRVACGGYCAAIWVVVVGTLLGVAPLVALLLLRQVHEELVESLEQEGRSRAILNSLYPRSILNQMYAELTQEQILQAQDQVQQELEWEGRQCLDASSEQQQQAFLPENAATHTSGNGDPLAVQVNRTSLGYEEDEDFVSPMASQQPRQQTIASSSTKTPLVTNTSGSGPTNHYGLRRRSSGATNSSNPPSKTGISDSSRTHHGSGLRRPSGSVLTMNPKSLSHSNHKRMSNSSTSHHGSGLRRPSGMHVLSTTNEVSSHSHSLPPAKHHHHEQQRRKQSLSMRRQSLSRRASLAANRRCSLSFHRRRSSGGGGSINSSSMASSTGKAIQERYNDCTVLLADVAGT